MPCRVVSCTQEAATEGSSEFEEASLASKRKQFQQANDKFAEGTEQTHSAYDCPPPMRGLPDELTRPHVQRRAWWAGAACSANGASVS